MTSRFSFSRSGTESSTSTSNSSSSAWSRPSIRGRAATWREKDKKKKAAEAGLVEDFYSVYELDWDALRDWLADRFPGVEFGEGYDASGDYYRFRVPRKLTVDEKREIWYLRNDQKMARREEEEEGDAELRNEVRRPGQSS